MTDAVSRRLIHAGFIVHDRAAEDHFYQDILGFHLYWYGGMKPDRTDWVAMQVPDGTDWLEYMLNQPMNPDLRLTGVMNHISFGVADMKEAQAIMEKHGWKANGDEQAEIGKDGKWQLDVPGPDVLQRQVHQEGALATARRAEHVNVLAGIRLRDRDRCVPDGIGKAQGLSRRRLHSCWRNPRCGLIHGDPERGQMKEAGQLLGHEHGSLS